MSARIQVLCGMIASGKSSYARLAARQGALCVNDDAIVAMVHGGDYQLYDRELKKLYKTVENHLVGMGVLLGRVVVIDRGLNISRQGRNRWLALARSYDVPCEAIAFPRQQPGVHARWRTETDGRGHDYAYWLEVAQHHASRYSEPTLEEGFDRVHHITYRDILEGKLVA